jgi:hypothetical protein
MKSLIAAAAVIAAFTSFAHADEVAGNVRNSHAQMQPRVHRSTVVSTDVVVDGRVVGRDPSLSTRMAIANEFYSLSAAAGGGGDAGAGAAAAP